MMSRKTLICALAAFPAIVLIGALGLPWWALMAVCAALVAATLAVSTPKNWAEVSDASNRALRSRISRVLWGE